MKPRTFVQFQCNGNIWPVVDAWAHANGYRPIAAVGPERTYQKGIGFWVAPMMLRIQQVETVVSLEAWVAAGFFARMCSLFILPAEMEVGSGGFRGCIPRGMARGAVNQLLYQLGCPTPIQ